ncbi:MAG TPA: dihydroorotate dehydrogenase electron transfer subunit, partial [Pirellulaceae bacterium]|nr:dihydroorotate dehydrogenase electron transfer subunit [Pirellulaceae bacterium]
RLWQLQVGQCIEVWGPLGNGFGASHHSPLTTHHSPSAKPPPVPTEHLILVAGGIGFTPFLALSQEALHKKSYGDPPRAASRALHITYCYGARSADYFADLAAFEQLGVEIRLTTDDGSRGRHGLVTELLPDVLAGHHGRPHIVCCGPEKMMEAVAAIAREANVPCEVSLETPMACGIGICFTCVAKVRQADGDWDWKRTCVEGPVFDAEEIWWP